MPPPFPAPFHAQRYGFEVVSEGSCTVADVAFSTWVMKRPGQAEGSLKAEGKADKEGKGAKGSAGTQAEAQISVKA